MYLDADYDRVYRVQLATIATGALALALVMRGALLAVVLLGSATGSGAVEKACSSTFAGDGNVEACSPFCKSESAKSA